MDLDNEPEGADAELTSLLAAELDKAEGIASPEPEAEQPEAVETEQQKADRLRDDKGRFAKAEEKEAEPAPAIAKAVEAAKVAPKPEDAAAAAKAAEPAPAVDATALRPPPGWSPTSKAAFDSLPAHVREDVAKREKEIDKGFAKLAEYKPIERYADMARQSGTTLDRALENYTGIENALRQDFVGGISSLCQRQGVDPVALANVILARSGMAPAQEGTTGTADKAPQRPSVDLTPVMQKISALENYIQSQQQSTVQSEIERFASDPKHTFFENVKERMGHLIKSGAAETLDDAYDQACWANKEIRDLLIKQQSVVTNPSAKAAAANQARQAAKSITGSPVPGASSARKAESSIEDEVRAAFESASV